MLNTFIILKEALHLYLGRFKTHRCVVIYINFHVQQIQLFIINIETFLKSVLFHLFIYLSFRFFGLIQRTSVLRIYTGEGAYTSRGI